MNAVIDTLPAKKKPGTALTVQERATRALKVTEKREQELRALAESSKDIVAITNADGREQVHAMCMVLRNTRLDIGSDADSVREDAKQFNKSVLALEKKLIGITQPEEDRLRKLRDDWDEERQRDKDAAIAAEQKRVADLQQRVSELRGAIAVVAGFYCASAEIAEHIADLERVPVDESFEEFQALAAQAKEETLELLRGMHAGAVAREAEAERLRLEREELERLRDEQARRDAEERAKREAADAAAATRQSELDEQAERQKREQELMRRRMADIERVQSLVTYAQAEWCNEPAKLETLLQDITTNWLVTGEAFGPLLPWAQQVKATALTAIEDALNSANAAAAVTPARSQENEPSPPGPVVAELHFTDCGPTDELGAPVEAMPAVADWRPNASEIVMTLANHFGVTPDTVLGWLREIDLKNYFLPEAA